MALSSPAGAAFEPPRERLNAEELVAGRLMRGPAYRILPEVENRGLMNHYDIETDFGPMRASSDRKLRQRLHEIRALRELERMHEGLLVARSVGGTFMSTVRSVARVIKDPVDTARGVGRGIQRLMRRGGRRIADGYEAVKKAVSGSNDTEREGAGGGGDADLSAKALQAGRRFARNRLGVSRAYRNLARQVGVDPYTDNRMVRAALNRLAKPAAGASLGSRLVIPRIPGLIGAVESVSDLVWSRDRLDLQLHNEDVLGSLAVPDPVIRRFIDNETYTPTQQTAIVAAVAGMDGVSNRWRLIEYAGDADREAEAEFYANAVGLLAQYHEGRAPLDTIHPTGTIVPLALTRDHRAVVAFPVDRLRWTRDVAGFLRGLMSSQASYLEHREIWVTGEVSRLANEAFADNGWIPFSHAHQRLPARR